MPTTPLADAINFPLIAAWGFAAFVPMTLRVSLIESHVLGRVVRVPARTVFSRVLWANLLSTLAGSVLYLFQDFLVFASGITGSIANFSTGYRWLAVVLVLIYPAKSLLVEGLVVGSPNFVKRLQRPRT